jgi:DNA-binding CsgD family transcriptional regulator/tetratricopeptide (TPR) repeat protein
LGRGRGAETTTKHVDFVGRERERDLLVEALHAALGGRAQVGLVAGEPGAGKTRLAEEIAGTAGRLGMRSCWGRVTDDEASPPYWPFSQVVRALHGSEPAGDLALVAPQLGGASDLTAPEQRFQVFEAVTGLLRTAAEPAGLLVVLDDLQWADPGSLRLLTHLARGAAGARLAVLATYRDTETVGREPLRRALSALAREPSVTRLRLPGLTESEVGTLLAGVTGHPVDGPTAAAVSRRTGGNPFFVTEVGRIVTESGVDLPDGVRDAVRSRLARLSVATGRIVAAAAVLGALVEPPAVAAAAGVPIEDVLTALDEAAAAGILTGPGDWRFGHDLIRETARLGMSTVDRMALHQRAADYLAGRVDAAARVAEVAFHLLESLPVGDPARAARWAERAAEQATAQLAWEEAAALYRRAVSCAADAAWPDADRARLLLATARAEVRAYEMEAARRSLLAAADLARTARDPVGIAKAALIMEGVTDFIWDDTGAALYTEALAGLPEQDGALRARVLAQLAVVESWRAFGEAEPRSAEALAMAERVGDPRAVREALRARQVARSGPDGTVDRIGLGDRMLAVGERDGDDDTALWGRLWRFDALAQLGEIDRAEAELGPIGTLVRRLRSPLAEWHATRSRAAIAFSRGRFQEATELGTQAAALASAAGHFGALLPSLGFLRLVHGHTGADTAELDAVLEDASVDVAPMRAVSAMMALFTGRREDARRIYRMLDPPGSEPGFLLLPALGATAELAAEFDDRATAARVYRLLAPHADRFMCGGAGIIAVLGSVHRSLGLAAATVGRLDDAVRHLRTAAERDDAAGLAPFAAFSRFELARVLARRKRPGDQAEAAALAASAGAEAGRLGMNPLRGRCAKLTESLAGTEPGPLTKREREIATLVSRGLTSRQIAAAAHISERTAENHVQHILGKLGFSSRAQIAAWVVAGPPEMSTSAE